MSTRTRGPQRKAASAVDRRADVVIGVTGSAIRSVAAGVVISVWGVIPSSLRWVFTNGGGVATE
jgi:hypothetical protein